MDCKHIREELSAYIDGVLVEPYLSQVAAHLAACPGCAAEEEELREVVEMVRMLGDVAPPAEFRAEVMARLRAEANLFLARDKAAGTAGLTKWGARWWQYTSLAAVLVLGIGISVLWGQGLQTVRQFVGGVGSTPDKENGLNNAVIVNNNAASTDGEKAKQEKYAFSGATNAREYKPAGSASAPGTGKGDPLSSTDSINNAAVADTTVTSRDAQRNSSPAAAGNGIKTDKTAPGYDLSAKTLRGTVTSRSPGSKSITGDNNKIISEGAMQIEVSDLALAVSQVDKIAAELGGRVEVDASAAGFTAGANSRAMRLIVPGRQFDRAVAAVSKLGRVLGKQVTSQDVTVEYNDLAARNGDSVISEAQLTQMDEAVNFATITLEVRQRG